MFKWPDRIKVTDPKAPGSSVMVAIWAKDKKTGKIHRIAVEADMEKDQESEREKWLIRNGYLPGPRPKRRLRVIRS